MATWSVMSLVVSGYNSVRSVAAYLGRNRPWLVPFRESENADEFTLPVTQEELAGMVGASRERVNKAIASFIRLGWIDQHDRKYTIIKRDSLEIRAR